MALTTDGRFVVSQVADGYKCSLTVNGETSYKTLMGPRVNVRGGEYSEFGETPIKAFLHLHGVIRAMGVEFDSPMSINDSNLESEIAELNKYYA